MVALWTWTVSPWVRDLHRTSHMDSWGLLCTAILSSVTLPHRLQLPQPTWTLISASQVNGINQLELFSLQFSALQLGNYIQLESWVINGAHLMNFLSLKGLSHVLSVVHCLKKFASNSLFNFIAVYVARADLLPVTPT